MAKKSGSKKFDIQSYAGLAAGAIAASKVSTMKLPINLPGPIQAALPLVLGVILSRRSGILGDVGKGMIAVGGTKLIGTLAPNLGISQDTEEDMISDYMITGADNYALAGATDSMPVGATTYALAGVDVSDNLMFG